MFKFTQGDIVKRVTKSRNLNSGSCIVEGGIYKVSTVHNDYVTLEGIVGNISSDSLIIYQMQVGDYVRRIKEDYEDIIVGCIYKISSILPRDIKIEGSVWAYTSDYFEPVLTTDHTTIGICPSSILVDDTVDDEDTVNDTPFKVGDIVIRNTDKYETSFMKKGKAYKISEIISDLLEFEGSTETFCLKYFNRIKFKFNVGDIVQSIKKNGTFKRGKVHTLSQNGSHFYFENISGTQSIIKHKVSDFELVAECKNAHSNNDGCVSDKNGNIDFSNFKPIRLQGTSCPPTINVGYAGPIGNVGDSIYPNPITPMKTFNEYAVEAFMSNEVNRTNATNALVTLNKLNDDLTLAIEATKKVRSVILSDLCKLQTAMSSSDIEVISALIAENAEVKEYVERFMENTLVQILPIPENTNKTVQDKFK